MLSFVWLAIGLIFIYFSITFHRYNKTPQGSSIVREGRQMLSRAKSRLEETNSLNPLLEDFDRYLGSTGLKLVARTRIASIGFLLAGFASLLSAYIS